MDALLSRLRAEIDAAVDGMSGVDWTGSPEGKWNTAQILEHLGRAFGGSAKQLELALSENRRPEPRRRKPGEWLATLIVVGLGHFPSGRPAPERTLPKGLDGPEALRRLHENVERMDAAFALAEKTWGGDVQTVQPTLGPLTPRQWRRFHYLHTPPLEAGPQTARYVRGRGKKQLLDGHA